VIPQIVGGFWFPAIPEVGRRRARNHVQLRHSPRSQSGLAYRTHAQRNVDALGHEVDDPVVQAQVEFDQGISARELGQRWQQQVAAEGHRDVDTQFALRLGARITQSFFGVAQLLEDAARTAQELGAFGCEGDATRGAVEQAGAEVFFERGDMGAGGRTRDFEFVRGPAEGSALGDPHEHPHGGQLVHAAIVL
jgi:hypothetical protein